LCSVREILLIIHFLDVENTHKLNKFMMTKFERELIPVAYSMIAIAEQKAEDEIYEKYLNFWMAFNNIYTTIAFTNPNLRQTLGYETDNNGIIKRTNIGNLQIPKVRLTSEREQIELSFTEFDDTLKNALISHDNTSFFVNRTPNWLDQPISADSLGQNVNGVLNINKMIDSTNPVWSPIEKTKYDNFVSGNHSDRDELAKQILFLLYAIRCNLMHGGKRYDDAIDRQVVGSALPLLELIVRAFLNIVPNP
jgi:hypothetical protein